jgi:uncharacterized protein (TIGR02145 family)
MRNLMFSPTMVLSVLTGWMLLFSGCAKEPDVPVSGKFIDTRDQKEYKWVIIGTQTWMAENLAYLPAVSPPLKGSDTAKYYYVFRFEGTSVTAAKEWEYYSSYGVFYNWPAAMDGSDSSKTFSNVVKGICPEGWHLPSDGEWDILVNSLGGEYTAGKKMKSTKGWNTLLGESGVGDNSSGFNALAAGSRQSAGLFYHLGFNALFWSSTGYDEYSAWYRNLGYNQNGVNRYYFNKSYGFSVRCVRNTL